MTGVGGRRGRYPGQGSNTKAEVGASGLLVVSTVTAVAALGLVIPMASGLFTAHTKADSAADLTALAAAGSLLTDTDPCSRALATAAANGAQLQSCSVEGISVSIQVAAPVPGAIAWLTGRPDLSSRAKAVLPITPVQAGPQPRPSTS